MYLIKYKQNNYFTIGKYPKSVFSIKIGRNSSKKNFINDILVVCSTYYKRRFFNGRSIFSTIGRRNVDLYHHHRPSDCLLLYRYYFSYLGLQRCTK